MGAYSTILVNRDKAKVFIAQNFWTLNDDQIGKILEWLEYKGTLYNYDLINGEDKNPNQEFLDLNDE